jgi:hypothetical protein
VPPTSTDEQDQSERIRETYEFCRQISHALDRGDLIIAELRQIEVSLADMDKRAAAIKGAHWPNHKRK